MSLFGGEEGVFNREMEPRDEGRGVGGRWTPLALVDLT